MRQQISNFNTPGFKPGLLQAFAITSDPQYPWTDCTEQTPRCGTVFRY
ncbi:hypothetical protein [Bacillus wiedmannii]|nr:hypothetical protein [Bacillus wiedmannii]